MEIVHIAQRARVLSGLGPHTSSGRRLSKLRDLMVEHSDAIDARCKVEVAEQESRGAAALKAQSDRNESDDRARVESSRGFDRQEKGGRKRRKSVSTGDFMGSSEEKPAKDSEKSESGDSA